MLCKKSNLILTTVPYLVGSQLLCTEVGHWHQGPLLGTIFRDDFWPFPKSSCHFHWTSYRPQPFVLSQQQLLLHLKTGFSWLKTDSWIEVSRLWINWPSTNSPDCSCCLLSAFGAELGFSPHFSIRPSYAENEMISTVKVQTLYSNRTICRAQVAFAVFLLDARTFFGSKPMRHTGLFKSSKKDEQLHNGAESF